MQLGPEDIVAEHPFTHPDHITGDLNVMRHMVDRLCEVLADPQLHSHWPQSLIVKRPQPDQWQHRMVIVQPIRLQRARHLTVVGFFGHKRRNVDPAQVIHPLDQLLVEELPEHPGLLSYSSLELEHGDYGNLVLFADDDAKNHWSTSKMHAQAVELAPGYYSNVRLYNGRLPAGILGSHTLSLTTVKYYDYETNPCWRAVRTIHVKTE